MRPVKMTWPDAYSATPLLQAKVLVPKQVVRREADAWRVGLGSGASVRPGRNRSLVTGPRVPWSPNTRFRRWSGRSPWPQPT